MSKKGLCVTCVHDKGCTFPRIFPVFQCEEFIDYGPKQMKGRVKKIKQRRR